MHLALIVVQLWFATLGVAMKIALVSMAPTAIVTARLLVAAIVFAVVWAAGGGERVAGRDLARIAAYAFFGLIANQLLFVTGLARTTATNAVVLGASIPVFTVGVAVVLRREQATPLKLLGLAVALAGALALAGVGRFRGGDPRAMVGNGLVLLNSLSYSIYLVLSRDVLGRYRTLTVVALTFAVGAIGVLPFGVRGFLAVAPTMPRAAWGALGYIVAFPTVGTYLLTAVALRRVPSSLVAVYIYLQPIVGALVAWRVLGERPGWDTLAAAAGIFLGIAAVGYDARVRARPPGLIGSRDVP